MPTWLGSRRIGGPHDWDVPDAVHRALRVLATRHGRSAGADIRNILERAVRRQSAFASVTHLPLVAQVGPTDEDIAVID
jgi:hypothetical protein